MLVLNICLETIYVWIYGPSQRVEKLWQYPPRHKTKRVLRKSKEQSGPRIQKRISIHERQKINHEFGHFEVDLMAFKKNAQHMLVIRERQTMFVLAKPLPSKKNRHDVKKAILHLINNASRNVSLHYI